MKKVSYCPCCNFRMDYMIRPDEETLADAERFRELADCQGWTHYGHLDLRTSKLFPGRENLRWLVDKVIVPENRRLREGDTVCR